MFWHICEVAKSFDLALEQNIKTKCKRFGLWIIRKVIACLQPYFFYTKRCNQLTKTTKSSL